MKEPTWTEIVTAVGAILTPLVVLAFGWILTRRQSRNELLLKARIEYYRDLAPDLNRLMTYMMFVGPWRDIAPPEVIALKRRLDSAFFVAAPLFSPQVSAAYREFMDSCFKTFGAWGSDALIRSSPYRRRVNWQSSTPWDDSWGKFFELREQDPVEKESLEAVKVTHDALISALVRDLSMNRTRSEYTSARVVMNAGGGVRTVQGSAEH